MQKNMKQLYSLGNTPLTLTYLSYNSYSELSKNAAHKINIAAMYDKG